VKLRCIFTARKCLLRNQFFFKVSLKNCLKAVTIQYLPMGGDPHGVKILNRHRFQTFFLENTLFFKRYFFDRYFLKDTFFKRYFFLKILSFKRCLF